MGATTKMLIAVVMASLVFWTGAAVAKWTGPDYDFQYHVHSHMENAYFAYAPEVYMEELNKTKDGMVALGLTPDMYAKFFPWEKTPDWRMDYQFRHIDGLVLRGMEVVQWREANKGSAQFVDIYNQKMQNVRNLLKADGDWSDDIARGAYWANKHPFYYFAGLWMLVNVGLGFGLVIGTWRLGVYIEDRAYAKKHDGKKRDGEWDEEDY